MTRESPSGALYGPLRACAARAGVVARPRRSRREKPVRVSTWNVVTLVRFGRAPVFHIARDDSGRAVCGAFRQPGEATHLETGVGASVAKVGRYPVCRTCRKGER